MLSETIRDQWVTRYGRSEPKVLCVGLNYRDHTGESGLALPEQPLFFAKFANTLCATGDSIVLPPAIGHVDAEAELAVVIGRMACNIDAAEAIDVIDSYSVGTT
jgi:2-keto-4-pentenoate hydratase/2-oxohepta-3-ene-1,7-dioic acid hydratase in catechol pathway